jgi:hypothetical protein
MIGISETERIACRYCERDVSSEDAFTFSMVKQFLVKIDTSPAELNVTGLPTEEWVTDGRYFSRAVPNIVNGSTGIRYVFVGWAEQGKNDVKPSIPIIKATTVLAVYKTQFYLEVGSSLGSPTGSGWYDKGSNATISIQKELPATGILDTLGFKWVFSGWTWNTQSPPPTAASAKVQIDSPTRVEAKWSVQPNERGLLVIGVITFVVGLLAVLIYRKSGRSAKKIALPNLVLGRMLSRHAPKTQEPRPILGPTIGPQISYQETSAKLKYCLDCGAAIPRRVKYCVECGGTQTD